VTLLAPLALLGLLLTVPIVVLHLRHRRPPERTVPSLLLEEPAIETPRARSRRWGPPPLPLLLALQVLAVVLLAVAIAEPAGRPHRAEGASTAYVVDGSLWMQARGEAGDRMAAARARLRTQLREQGDRRVVIVLAGPTPRVVFDGAAGDATGAGVLDRLVATPTASTLPAAVALAADRRSGPASPLRVLHAPENPAPRVRATRGTYTATRVGGTIRDRGFTDADARCGLGRDAGCEILANVRQTAGPAATVPIRVTLDGKPATTVRTPVAAGASVTPVVLHAPAGGRVRLALPGGDAIPGDDTTAIAVPSATTTHVNVVAPLDRAGALVRAFSAVPNVAVRAIAPSAYRYADARDADLLVLDDWVPKGALPPARAVLLVDPPRVPGGAVHGTLVDGTPSGSSAVDPLLSGIQISALTADVNTARRLTLPRWTRAAVWAPGGPLLASGTDGVHRLAALAFDPGDSSLPQSEAFPVLAANLVAWAGDWIPQQAAPTSAVLAQTPPQTQTTALGGTKGHGTPAGFVVPDRTAIPTATQQGDWGARDRPVAVAVDASPGTVGAVDLRTDPNAAPTDRTSASPWLLLAALLVLLAEGVVIRRGRRGRAERAPSRPPLATDGGAT
jgi:hypothetical protein